MKKRDSQPPAGEPLKVLTVIIPARNEEGCIGSTVEHLHGEFRRNGIEHEILVIDDGSTDNTWRVLAETGTRVPTLRPLQNRGQHGFGRAVTLGIDQMKGDAAIIMMADASDDSRDAVKYWTLLNQGWDAVFGSRFVRGGTVIDYPFHKLILNRLANYFLMFMFHSGLNDTTNAFKAYRRSVLEGCRPFLSPHFNLTVELPLKTIVRGYSWTVTPISWKNRKSGFSKLKIREMGSRYLFIALYCWLERYFSRGDYRKETLPALDAANRTDDRQVMT